MGFNPSAKNIDAALSKALQGKDVAPEAVNTEARGLFCKQCCSKMEDVGVAKGGQHL